MFTWKQIGYIILIVITTVLLVQNSYSVPIKFTVLSFNLPLSILLLLVLGIGIAFGFWLDRRAERGKKQSGKSQKG